MARFAGARPAREVFVLDVFAIVLMVLSCVLAPADAQRILIDALEPSTGRVHALTAVRTPTGFTVEPGGITITDRGDGTFVVDLPGVTAEPLEVDLSRALARLADDAGPASVGVEGGEVRVARSAGLLYVFGAGEASGQIVHVVRAAPPAPAFAAPATQPGEGEFAGWEVYGEPWELTRAQARSGLTSGQGSPAEAVASFFASLLRGDDDFVEVLSPRFEPALRGKLVAQIRERTRDLTRVAGHAQIERARVLELTKGPGAELDGELTRVFGLYDVLLFAEGNTDRDDIFVLLDRVEGRWYVKGIGARFARFLAD